MYERQVWSDLEFTAGDSQCYMSFERFANREEPQRETYEKTPIKKNRNKSLKQKWFIMSILLNFKMFTHFNGLSVQKDEGILVVELFVVNGYCCISLGQSYIPTTFGIKVLVSLCYFQDISIKTL